MRPAILFMPVKVMYKFATPEDYKELPVKLFLNRKYGWISSKASVEYNAR